ncbi:DUF1178 family protein [Alteraurantiacibacter palmitatis]|uniref:DUF1178 family protein n=1 Tax=Alteraurantiacibacter palmitatis TaxID=2054628 RepID=A0ABV7E149_9SPHN
MIVFDLSCGQGHRFEGWFGSSGDFVAQKQRGLLSCPQCGDGAVEKAPMAPAVPRKGNQRAEGPMRGHATPAMQQMSNAPVPPEVQQALARLAEAQARALKNSKWVGSRFADDARAMHYGEIDPAPIHGEASLEEAKRLLDEGVEIVPLPFPVAPPKAIN